MDILLCFYIQILLIFYDFIVLKSCDGYNVQGTYYNVGNALLIL